MVTATKKNGASPMARSAVFEIPSLDIQTFNLRLTGESPLIMHRFSEKARKQIEDKQQQLVKAGARKPKRDPEAEYHESYYQYASDRTDPRDSGSKLKWDKKSYGFPSVGFKAAAVSAAGFLDKSITKVAMRGLFHIPGTLVKIEGKPRMRTDMVRIGMGTSDVRYRAEFPEWAATLEIAYDADGISPAHIAHLFQRAGFSVGVGDWRTEKDGNYGMFRVSFDEVKA